MDRLQKLQGDAGSSLTGAANSKISVLETALARNKATAEEVDHLISYHEKQIEDLNTWVGDAVKIGVLAGLCALEFISLRSVFRALKGGVKELIANTTALRQAKQSLLASTANGVHRMMVKYLGTWRAFTATFRKNAARAAVSIQAPLYSAIEGETDWTLYLPLIGTAQRLDAAIDNAINKAVQRPDLIAAVQASLTEVQKRKAEVVSDGQAANTTVEKLRAILQRIQANPQNVAPADAQFLIDPNLYKQGLSSNFLASAGRAVESLSSGGSIAMVSDDGYFDGAIFEGATSGVYVTYAAGLAATDLSHLGARGIPVDAIAAATDAYYAQEATPDSSSNPAYSETADCADFPCNVPAPDDSSATGNYEIVLLDSDSWGWFLEYLGANMTSEALPQPEAVAGVGGAGASSWASSEPSSGSVVCPPGQTLGADGVCVATCPDGSLPDPTFETCADTGCPVGMLVNASGSCEDECPDGTLPDSTATCDNGCPVGNVPVSGSCVELCTNGLTPDATGSCACPSSMTLGETGTCEDACGDGLAVGRDGRLCPTSCSGGQVSDGAGGCTCAPNELLDATGTCQVPCADGFSLPDDTGTCPVDVTITDVVCSTPQAVSADGQSCLCPDGTSPSNGLCPTNATPPFIPDCPPGYVVDYDFVTCVLSQISQSDDAGLDSGDSGGSDGATTDDASLPVAGAPASNSM